jgi:hypothetical protein
VGSNAVASEIYINQIGDNLDLDIVQTGTDNFFGDASGSGTTSGGTQKPVVLEGDDMTFSITQTGNNNEIAATIKGNTYTGTWQFTGDNNTVDMTCDSQGAVQCETVTVDITTNGSNNAFNVFIGENKIADNLVATFTVDGDSNTVNADLDAVNADVTVTVDNTASLAETGNTFNIDQDDAGDINGHSITYDHTGGGGTVNITQSGLTDKTVDVTSSGDNHQVDITQTD